MSGVPRLSRGPRGALAAAAAPDNDRPTCALTPAHLAQLRGMARELEAIVGQSRALSPEAKAQRCQRARDLVAFVERAYFAGADLLLVDDWVEAGQHCRIWVRADGSSLSVVGEVGEHAPHPYGPERAPNEVRADTARRAREFAAGPRPPLPPAA